MEEQAEGLVPSLRAAALLVGPPWVVANGVWSERWWGNWELVLLVVGEHAGEVPMMQVLAEEVPMVLVLVLLVCRWQLRGKRKMGVDRNIFGLTIQFPSFVHVVWASEQQVFDRFGLISTCWTSGAACSANTVEVLVHRSMRDPEL